jgi:Tol biopolymer transport system component
MFPKSLTIVAARTAVGLLMAFITAAIASGPARAFPGTNGKLVSSFQKGWLMELRRGHCPLGWPVVRGSILLCVAVALALSFSDGAGSRSRVSAAASHLLFTSNRDGDADAYAIGADGSRLAALTRDSRETSAVVVSPNGARLAFSRGDHLFTVGASGRSPRRLGRGQAVAWSPTNRELAYARIEDHTVRIHIVNADGSDDHAFGAAEPSGPAPDEFAGWSADGATVAFTRWVSDASGEWTQQQLLIATAAGGATRAVAQENSVGQPAWSPVGRQLAYVGARPSSSSILILDPDSGRSRELAVARMLWRDRVAWAPDGKQLAFLSLDFSRGPVKASLEVVGLSGSRRVLAARLLLAGESMTPRWSPDGRYISYVDATKKNGAPRVRVVRADGSKSPVTLATIPRLSGYKAIDPIWSPQSDAVAFATDRLETVAVRGRRPRLLTDRGDVSILGWMRGSVPATAPRARRLPPIELSARLALRSRGRVRELVSARGGVAVVLGASHLDCAHVLAWTPRAEAVARATVPTPCNDPSGSARPDGWLGGLRSDGRILHWSTEWLCGNSGCYSVHFAAERVSPTRLKVSFAGEEVPVRLGASVKKLRCVVCREPNPTRARPDVAAEVVMWVAGRSVAVRLAGSGHVRRFSPPGTGPVLARLEPNGLFVGYNVAHGLDHGRVIFIPLAKLRRSARR